MCWAMDWSIDLYWINPSWVAVKNIFYDAICRFRLILAFFEQKVPKHGVGMVLFKNKCQIWTFHTQISLHLPISLLNQSKRFWAPEEKPEKTLRLHSFCHVTWKSRVDLPGEFFLSIKQTLSFWQKQRNMILLRKINHRTKCKIMVISGFLFTGL